MLRNNITTEECPLGVYHPHDQYHHIKKENIGLIEVMGLAVLPARLKDEIEDMKQAVLTGQDFESVDSLLQHAKWLHEVVERHSEIDKDNIDAILKEEIGKVFVGVLEDAGVYKCTPDGRAAFDRFIACL